MQLVTKDVWVPDDLKARLREYNPRTDFGRIVKDVCRTLEAQDSQSARYMAAELIGRVSTIVVVQSELHAKVYRGRDGLDWSKLVKREVSIEDYGRVGFKVVTDTGVGFIVDAFQNLVELENMKFHGIGTGSTAENATDTALVTELTTEYNPDSTRATGTTTEQAANIYKTVATNTLDGTPGAALREHGVFTQAATGGGVLLDRTVYAAITLSSGDGLQTDYRLTLTSGG